MFKIVWSNLVSPEMLWVIETELRIQVMLGDMRKMILEIERIKHVLGVPSQVIPAPNPGGGRIVQPRGFMIDPSKRQVKGRK